MSRLERERKEVSFYTSKKAFNSLIEVCLAQPGQKGTKHWLGSSAEITHDKHFEEAAAVERTQPCGAEEKFSSPSPARRHHC